MKNLLLVFCLLPLFTFSQNHLKIVDFFVQPEVGYRILSGSDEARITARNQAEAPGLGYRVGFNVSQLSRSGRVAWMSGLSYSTSKYYDENLENAPVRGWDAIEIPLTLRMYAGEKKCASFVDFGLGMHYRMDESLRRSDRIMASANLGFGFVWAFKKDFGIYGKLPMRYAITPYLAEKNVKENMVSVGFEIGVRRYIGGRY